MPRLVSQSKAARYILFLEKPWNSLITLVLPSKMKILTNTIFFRVFLYIIINPFPNLPSIIFVLRILHRTHLILNHHICTIWKKVYLNLFPFAFTILFKTFLKTFNFLSSPFSTNSN